MTSITKDLNARLLALAEKKSWVRKGLGERMRAFEAELEEAAAGRNLDFDSRFVFFSTVRRNGSSAHYAFRLWAEDDVVELTVELLVEESSSASCREDIVIAACPFWVVRLAAQNLASALLFFQGEAKKSLVELEEVFN